MRLRGVVVVAALVLVAADADDKVKKEQEQLQGDWRVVGLEVNDQKAPEEEAKKLRLVIKGDELTAHFEAENRTEKGKIKIDPGTKPKIMDFTYLEGDRKDMKLEGIYELDKDDLKICMNLMGQSRPTEFKGGADSILLTLKREKK